MVKITEEGITYHCSICGQYKNDRPLYGNYIGDNGKEKYCCDKCYKEKVDNDTMRLRSK